MDLESRKEVVLRAWETETDMEKRDTLLEEMRSLGLFPRLSAAADEWEASAGLYPDLDDPRFTEKLMKKLEFAEAKQTSIKEQMESGVNPCTTRKGEFELTPVQRFVSRFLSPQCPYQSALLYHGVGVGKTCAAITIAENYLDIYPRRSVIIVAPRTIQAGFRAEIFSEDRLRIGAEEGEPNTATGCTGGSYLRRTAMEYERDPKAVVRAVNAAIQSRYMIMGYIQFHRYIEDLLKDAPKGLPAKEDREAKAQILGREFSGRLVIIDEAHNLRDSPAETADDDVDAAGGEVELEESQAGKRLTPSLLRVLRAADGMRLVLATATPMYNSYKEILFLLNLLLINDKRDERVQLSEADVFKPNGEFIKAANGRPSGEEKLGSVAAAYVSFMRGENPLSFPARLPPMGVPPLKGWPSLAPNAKEVTGPIRKRMLKLPFVPVEFEPGSDAAEAYLEVSTAAIEREGMGMASIDEMVQAGNWLFPVEGGELQTRDTGFDLCFVDTAGGAASAAHYAGRGDMPPNWLLTENLGTASPKTKLILERLPTCQGIAFIYSRFIKAGSLPLALALEANGYTRWDEPRGLLDNGVLDGLGRQCALCPRREANHRAAAIGHSFTPAKYILLTGNSRISRKNAAAIAAARAASNKDGSEIKVIVGSSVASEGVDFRFVREIYVFDSWFHLNKMEQVLGRGVRTCSHALLPPEKRNCTIHLLINTFGEDEDTETADMYMYREGMVKAIRFGRVTRVLKRYALDCNLNRDAILVKGLTKKKHIDSQGNKDRPPVDLDDTPFTAMCDWMECSYECEKAVDVDADPDTADTSTYDEYAGKWHLVQLKTALRNLFSRKYQVQFAFEEIREALKGVPEQTLAALLHEIVGNRSFQVVVRGVKGYIVYRNNYYLFQPDHLADLRIPMAMRLSSVPVRRDSYTPAALPSAPNPEVAAPAAAAAPTTGPTSTASDYWAAAKDWSRGIANLTAPLEDLPGEMMRAAEARYSGDELKRGRDQMTMVNWMYETIAAAPEEVMTTEKKRIYAEALAQAFLECVWDEEFNPTEQGAALKGGEDAVARAVASQQILRSGAREAFRYVDLHTGKLVYLCEGDQPCSEAVARVLDAEPSDPLKGVVANRETAGRIYGFNVPKGREGRMVFKTNDMPVPPGSDPGKGSECSIVSTISLHIRDLLSIGELFEEEGYPRFLLTPAVLENRERRSKTVPENRQFKGAVRACALKNISLRLLEILKEREGGGSAYRHYFYRPVAAKKTNHKGSVLSKSG